MESEFLENKVEGWLTFKQGSLWLEDLDLSVGCDQLDLDAARLGHDRGLPATKTVINSSFAI
jgi:hypothetical protein